MERVTPTATAVPCVMDAILVNHRDMAARMGNHRPRDYLGEHTGEDGTLHRPPQVDFRVVMLREDDVPCAVRVPARVPLCGKDILAGLDFVIGHLPVEAVRHSARGAIALQGAPVLRANIREDELALRVAGLLDFLLLRNCAPNHGNQLAEVSAHAPLLQRVAVLVDDTALALELKAVKSGEGSAKHLLLNVVQTANADFQFVIVHGYRSFHASIIPKCRQLSSYFVR